MAILAKPFNAKGFAERPSKNFRCIYLRPVIQIWWEGCNRHSVADLELGSLSHIERQN